MKVFVHYEPHDFAGTFEGVRLRKTIKGACEAARLFWVDHPQDGVAVAHFISPDDLALLRQQKEAGVPTVVSAFYTEDDPHAHYLSGTRFPHLSKKGLLFLNEADMVLVPDARMRELAKYEGVTAPIEVVPPAVRMNRFSKNTPEAKAFLRYFGIREEQNTVVSTGSYHDFKHLRLLKAVAAQCPDLEFYFFGTCHRADLLHFEAWLAKLRAPKNLHLREIVQDDIYRSALIHSMAYISCDDVRPDPVAPIEAFAAKTQVVALAPSRYANPLLVEGQTARYFDTPEEMGVYLNALNLGTAESTIDSAYAVTKEHNLISLGKRLKTIYEALASGENR